MYLIFAIIFGLVINYFWGGFNFSTGICFFAALVLIYPILLKLNFQDFKLFLKNKKIIFVDLFVNFVLLPVLAFLIAYVFFRSDNSYFIFSLILLSILPGGGLLLSWIHHSKANEKIGFLLLGLNLFVFSLVYILFNFSLDYFTSKKIPTNNKVQTSSENLILNNIGLNGNSFINFYQPQQNNKTKGCIVQQIVKKSGLSCFKDKTSYIYGIYAFFILILFPLVLAFFTKLLHFHNKIIKLIPYFSKIGSFILIMYIFSLSEIKKLFSYNDFELLIKIFFAVFLFYLFSLLFNNLVLKLVNLDEATKKSIFWNGYVRFITLGFILSMFYVYNLSAPVEIVFIFLFSYFIQIISSTLYLKILSK